MKPSEVPEVLEGLLAALEEACDTAFLTSLADHLSYESTRKSGMSAVAAASWAGRLREKVARQESFKKLVGKLVAESRGSMDASTAGTGKAVAREVWGLSSSRCLCSMRAGETCSRCCPSPEVEGLQRALAAAVDGGVVREVPDRPEGAVAWTSSEHGFGSVAEALAWAGDNPVPGGWVVWVKNEETQ